MNKFIIDEEPFSGEILITKHRESYWKKLIFEDGELINTTYQKSYEDGFFSIYSEKQRVDLAIENMLKQLDELDKL